MRDGSQGKASSLLQTVLSVIIYIVAFAMIFQSRYPDVPLTGILTGSTILGIVVGLALQDTLGNLFAGIALQADQAFQVGDVIDLKGKGSGVVENVSWRGVRIRTFQNKLLVISNAVLGKELIEVAAVGSLSARIVFFNTVYNVSPARTAQVVRDAIRGTSNLSVKMRPVIRIRSFGDSSLDWEVKYWLDDYRLYNDTDALIRERIWYGLNRAKIDFAFPTRTVYSVDGGNDIPVEEMISTTVEILSHVDVFAPLSDEDLRSLADAAVSHTYAPGEAIVRKGSDGDSMFIIVRGQVAVQIPGKSAPEVVNRLYVNDFFGEMSLFTGEPRSATVVAQEETAVLQIGTDAVKPIFEKTPELADTISEIIVTRRNQLADHDNFNTETGQDSRPKILTSIVRFFGLQK